MGKIRLGIVGPADIGFRRFLPALKANENFEFIGVAVANPTEWFQKDNSKLHKIELEISQTRAENYVNQFGGIIFNSYEELLSSDKIDAVYIPLPPALHYEWARKALEYGKHVLLEKPFTTNISDTKKLIKIAEAKKLALQENYAFCYHKQISQIHKLIFNWDIGELRLIRTAFGFPYRGSNDFRYNADLGGGALLDCGGYPAKIASHLLGDSAHIVTASLNTVKGHEVDIFGSATVENDEHIIAQIAFGMDNAYKCELEIWGSEGCIYAPRVFTAPADFSPVVVLKKQDEKVFEIPRDDQFLGSIKHFYKCILDDDLRRETFADIELQSRLIDEIRKIGWRNKR